MNTIMTSPTLSFKSGFLSEMCGINFEVTYKYYASIGISYSLVSITICDYADAIIFGLEAY
jgi:hypothetical protein